MLQIFSGTHKHQKIATPKGLQTRPTAGRVREAVFNICQTYIQDAEFLDLFAGSGAMGLEALSRGAARATFVDADKESIRCIQQNLRQMKLEDRAQVLHGDVFTMMEKLAKQAKRYDIIYTDPPYDTWESLAGEETTYSRHLLKIVDGSELLLPTGVLFIEEARHAQPTAEGLRNLYLDRSRSMGKSALQQYKVTLGCLHTS
jgi:16S rRNA (guanine966-N2)-methyltransferase